MGRDEELAKKIADYQELTKENPNVNIGMLMANALSNEKTNSVSAKAKRWAYLISLGAPPLGLIFALKYFFDDSDDAKDVAWTCVVLTIIAVVMFWISAKLLLSGSGTSVEQIQKIKPSDAYQLLQ